MSTDSDFPPGVMDALGAEWATSSDTTASEPRSTTGRPPPPLRNQQGPLEQIPPAPERTPPSRSPPKPHSHPPHPDHNDVTEDRRDTHAPTGGSHDLPGMRRTRMPRTVRQDPRHPLPPPPRNTRTTTRHTNRTRIRQHTRQTPSPVGTQGSPRQHPLRQMRSPHHHRLRLAPRTQQRTHSPHGTRTRALQPLRSRAQSPQVRQPHPWGAPPRRGRTEPRR